MQLNVEIDAHSGFCGGVIRAIGQAEDYLDAHPGEELWSLGAIVHNEAAFWNSENIVIRNSFISGEYFAWNSRNITLIDCTCPVVLKLQQRIRQAYDRIREQRGQIIIFGKVGHAEVLGLVGQAGGDALVVENMAMLEDAFRRGAVCLDGPVEIFSQTTKSPSEYAAICADLSRRVGGPVTVHDTICKQVSSRHAQLTAFASAHDAVVFVSGKESSNGKVLCDLCRRVNERTFHAGGPEEVDPAWFRDGDRVGICGATSTPKWLLEAVAKKILHL